MRESQPLALPLELVAPPSPDLLAREAVNSVTQNNTRAREILEQMLTRQDAQGIVQETDKNAAARSMKIILDSIAAARSLQEIIEAYGHWREEERHMERAFGAEWSTESLKVTLQSKLLNIAAIKLQEAKKISQEMEQEKHGSTTSSRAAVLQATLQEIFQILNWRFDGISIFENGLAIIAEKLQDTYAGIQMGLYNYLARAERAKEER